MRKFYIILFFFTILYVFSEDFSFQVIEPITVADYRLVENGSYTHFIGLNEERNRVLLNYQNENRQLKEIPLIGKIRFILAPKNNGTIYICTYEDGQYKVIAHEPAINVVKQIDELGWLLEYNKKQPFHWFPYQNGEVFVQLVDFYPEWGADDSKLVLFNIDQKTEIEEMSGVAILGMTSDKVHLLMTKDKVDPLFIMITSKKEMHETKATQTWSIPAPPSEGILSNELYFAMPKGDYYENSGTGVFELYSFSNENFQYKIRFLVDELGIQQITFHSSLEFALVRTRGKQYLVDTTPFRDWLDEHNLLFKPTTGTLTASGISMRENPNLDAQILTRLDKGTVVDVTDRSGIKVEIGSDNDWWYKVTTNDNQTGWVYGPYLELEFYQGELEYKEAPPKVIDTGGF